MDLATDINLTRWVVSFLSLLVLLGGLALVARKLQMRNIRFKPGEKRLCVADSIMLDARHRLFIIKCDNKEHLIITGPNGCQVIGDRPDA